MPTLKKGQLERSLSVWDQPSARITELVFASGPKILTLLGFYNEHRAGNAEGRFDDVVEKFAHEVLLEISGALVEAANASARLDHGTVLATLKTVIRYPALFWERNLPGEVEWAIARHYKRSEDRLVTDSLDIIGDARASLEQSDETMIRIKDAATTALDWMQQSAVAGRPRNLANEILGDKFGGIFLRYNDRGLTRHSSIGNKTSQKEGGPFYEFVNLVIGPLQEFLQTSRLPPVTAATIVRRAIQFRYGKI